MSQLRVVPEVMTAAAADLETIGSTLNAAHLATAPATLSVAPAAADEVSASIAQAFSGHAQDYYAVARGAAAYQDQFVQNLRASAVSYAGAEDLSAALLAGWDAKLRYFESAGTAVKNIFAGFGGAIGAYFALPSEVMQFWAPLFFPIVSLAFVVDLARLFLEVITGQPISYSAP